MPAANTNPGVRNPARDKLGAGQLSLGVGIRMTRSVEIAKAMAVAGFDWLFPRHGARRHVARSLRPWAPASSCPARMRSS